METWGRALDPLDTARGGSGGGVHAPLRVPRCSRPSVAGGAARARRRSRRPATEWAAAARPPPPPSPRRTRAPAPATSSARHRGTSSPQLPGPAGRSLNVGSECGVPMRGPNMGSQCGVPMWGPNVGSLCYGRGGSGWVGCAPVRARGWRVRGQAASHTTHRDSEHASRATWLANAHARRHPDRRRRAAPAVGGWRGYAPLQAGRCVRSATG
jgi:hypothetical protein